MWIGHRDRPNEILIRNPALMGPAGQAAAALPAGHVEGFADTFRALFRAIYADVGDGGPSEQPGLPDLRGRPRRDARERRRGGQRARRTLDRCRPHRERAADGRRRRGVAMRLGFLTAPFPDTPLSEVADWAAANGFESLEIACWPRSTGTARRYAGTSHIDVAEPVRGAGARRSSTRSRRRAWRSRGSATTRTRCTPTPRCATPPSAT